MAAEVDMRKVPIVLCFAFAVTGFLPGRPSVHRVPALEEVTIEQATARIRATGRPTVAVFYKTTCSISRGMFPSLVALARSQPHVTFLVFSVDPDSTVARVPAYLSNQGAPFAAVHVRRWPAGAFIRAMGSIGIRVGQTWTTPLVAVRDSHGQTVWYREGVPTVAPLATALASLR